MIAILRTSFLSIIAVLTAMVTLAQTSVCIPAKLTPHSGKLTPHCLRLSIAYPTVKVIYFFSWIHL